jgi:pyroglutamyl-peptidase
VARRACPNEPRTFSELPRGSAQSAPSARRSIDAGRYLCNASYYQGLTQARVGTTVLFVHVPMPSPPAGTRRRRGRRRPMPDLTAMERGLSDIVLTLVRAARTRTRLS